MQIVKRVVLVAIGVFVLVVAIFAFVSAVNFYAANPIPGFR